MKLKRTILFSGVALTMIASVGIWQVLVVALLVHSIDEVIGAFGRLL
jgi:hypothetical protein